MSESDDIKAGDAREVAIPKLLEREGGRLYSLGRRLCGGPEAAEDLVQEVFLEAYKGWDRFEGRSSASTWLYSIAGHACQRMQRKRVGEPREMASLDALLPFAADTMVDVASLEHDDGSEDRREAVEAAITSLPEDFRLPLVLKDILGLSLAEIAPILGLKEATVKTRVHRARLKIRAALEEVLPRRPSTPFAYEKQVCLDLLQTKQEAIDRDVAFPMNDIVCERCRALFSTMDLAGQVCRDLGQGIMPPDLRDRLLRSVARS